MVSFFTTKDPLDKIIAETFPEKKIIQTEHILTGWTNIVIEVTTNEGSYFFRFPRNPFWSKMIVKDATVCNFVDGKTSFYTPQMKLYYDKKRRPYSVHEKIEGYTLGDRIYHLSHTALTGAAYDVAKFIKELSGIDLRGAPKEVKYPLSEFLKELDYEHYAEHIDADHEYIHLRSTKTGNMLSIAIEHYHDGFTDVKSYISEYSHNFKNVEYTIQKYSGSMTVKNDNGLISINMLLIDS